MLYHAVLLLITVDKNAFHLSVIGQECFPLKCYRYPKLFRLTILLAVRHEDMLINLCVFTEHLKGEIASPYINIMLVYVFSCIVQLCGIIVSCSHPLIRSYGLRTKTLVFSLLAVFCHSACCVTASRCARRFRLKELIE